MMRPSQVLLIGDTQYREFQGALGWLKEHTDLSVVDSTQDALRRLTGSLLDPQAIVFAQSRRGQFSQQEIESLREVSPLSHYFVLLSSWCEGETRTGSPYAGVERVYWSQWPSLTMQTLTACGAEEDGALTFPHTFTPAERLLQFSKESLPRGTGLVAIAAEHFETYDALSAICSSVGYSTAWISQKHQPHLHGAAAIIWDAEVYDQIEKTALRELARSWPSVPIVAILGFLRLKDRSEAIDSGVSAVLSKPFMIEGLLLILTRLTHQALQKQA